MFDTKKLAVILALILYSRLSLGEVEESLSSPLKFGHSLLGSEFLLNYTNFNHGSFGACPKTVLNYQASLRLQQEQQPDVWMRQHYRVLLNETREKLADFLGLTSSEAENLVLVESASTAVNTVLRSFHWNQGDILIVFSMTYPMVTHTAEWLEKLYGIQIVKVPIPFPLPENGQDLIVESLRSTLIHLEESNSLSLVKMIVLDHIVSAPAIKIPIQEAAALVKQYQPNCYVMVDGAHAIGQIPLAGSDFLSHIDAYLTNGHKWLYTPKGSALLWFNSSRVNSYFPEPTVIASSNNIATETISLSERFAYVSVRDYTGWLSMGKAIDFRAQQLGGEDAIYQYCRSLALQAKHHLMDLWNSTPIVPDDMEEFMVHVQLPAAINTVERGFALMEHLLMQHNIYLRNLYDATSGIVYARLSSQVYLEMSDFELLGKLVMDFANLCEKSEGDNCCHEENAQSAPMRAY